MLVTYTNKDDDAPEEDPEGSVSASDMNELKTAINFNWNGLVIETPLGTVNGSNTAFTLANTPESLIIFADGMVWQSPTDYSRTGVNITAVAAPETWIMAFYKKQS